eukprot:1184102-Prorocentrum_minimum.AAC.4
MGGLLGRTCGLLCGLAGNSFPNHRRKKVSPARSLGWLQEGEGSTEPPKPSKPAWGKLPSTVATKTAVLSDSGVAWPSLGDAKNKSAVSPDDSAPNAAKVSNKLI